MTRATSVTQGDNSLRPALMIFTGSSMHLFLSMAEKIGVGEFESFAQRRARRPAERMDAAGVEQLARRAVGTIGIEHEFSAESHHRGDLRRELSDGQVRAVTDIQEFAQV